MLDLVVCVGQPLRVVDQEAGPPPQEAGPQEPLAFRPAARRHCNRDHTARRRDAQKNNKHISDATLLMRLTF